MKTMECICAHNVEFDYHTKSTNATPTDSEIEHVQTMINDNYVEGELCMIKIINNREYEFRGYWHIID